MSGTEAQGPLGFDESQDRRQGSQDRHQGRKTKMRGLVYVALLVVAGAGEVRAQDAAAGEKVFGVADGAGPGMFAILIDHASGRSSDLSARGQTRGSAGIHSEKACGVVFRMQGTTQFL